MSVFSSSAKANAMVSGEGEIDANVEVNVPISEPGSEEREYGGISASGRKVEDSVEQVSSKLANMASFGRTASRSALISGVRPTTKGLSSSGVVDSTGLCGTWNGPSVGLHIGESPRVVSEEATIIVLGFVKVSLEKVSSIGDVTEDVLTGSGGASS